MHWGNGHGSWKRAASPSRAACTRWLVPLEVRAGVCLRDITTAARPREPRGPILSGEWQELGITGNLRRAAATASRWYWSLPELPTPPLTNPREGADRPFAPNSPRRTPQVARSAVAPSCSRTTFCKTWQSRNVWVCGEKKRVPVHVWCLADCQKIRPTVCPKCMRWGSCVIL